MEMLARGAAEAGTYLEINGSADRRDLTAQGARNAAAMGARLVISSDAHSPSDFDNLGYGVQEARRGWLTASDVANSRPRGSL